MTSLTKKEFTKRDAEKRTEQHVKDFSGLKKGWLHLGREVQKSMDLGVPGLLGKTARQWMAETFDESASHIYRQMQSYRALKGLPERTLESIPESNARELTRLNEKDRKSPEIICAAVGQPTKKFRETVNEIRREKYGIKTETWKALRFPESLYLQGLDAQVKVAEILGLNLMDESVRLANILTAWEAIFAFINTTPRERLLVELEGDAHSS